MQLMAVEGVMARRVADVRLGLVDRGRRCTRATRESVPVPLDVPRPSPRRVALLADPPGGDTHPEIAAAVRRAGDALADAGYDVVEAEPPPYEQALDVWGRFLFNDIRAQEALLRAVMGPDAIRFLDLIGGSTPPQDAAALVGDAGRAAHHRPRLERVPGGAPADPQPDLDAAAVPARLGRRVRGERARHDAADAARDAREPARPARPPPVNAGKAAGLPAGVQVMGARFQELACLEAAEAIETALGAADAIDPILGALASLA